MLQAEVGSAKVTEVGAYPSRGHLIGDFTLPSTGGKPVSPYDYRGRSNLVLIFAGDVGQAGRAGVPFRPRATLCRDSGSKCRGIAGPSLSSTAGGKDPKLRRNCPSSF